MNVQQKLALFFADPDISDAEFVKVKSWLEKGGIGKILGDADKIRTSLKSYRSPDALEERRKERSVGDPFVSEIVRLLRIEAGLSTSDALTMLQKQTNWTGSLPQKKSFVDGVTRLGNILGQSVVLSAAHQIRNNIVHSSTGVAWPLRRE